MRIIKPSKKTTLWDRTSFRRKIKNKSSSDDVVRCPDCESIAEKYNPYLTDDEHKNNKIHLHKSLKSAIGGLGGNRWDSQYVLYQCTNPQCKKVFRVRKKRKGHG